MKKFLTQKFKISKSFKKIALIFVLWRLGLFLLGVLSTKILPFKPSFPYYDAILEPQSDYQTVWHWANFDGPHYITLAEKGYVGTGLIQAFFPLYPLLIRWFSRLGMNFLYSGLLISNFSFLLALYFFTKLMDLEKIKEQKMVLALLLLFPTSFYFGAFYSESLFFLLSILSFLFLRRKKWIKAGLFAGLASAARLVGIFLLPAILWEYWQENKGKKIDKSKKIKFDLSFLSLKHVLYSKAGFYLKTIGLSLLGVSGFILFCWFLYKNFHNPFYFGQVQSGFGASRQTDKLILLHQVIWRYFKMMLTIKGNNLLLFTVGQEFFTSIAVLALLIWALFKKMKKSYLIYSFLSFFLPTLTGNFSSMPRYVSLIFPIYFILAQIKSRKIKNLILIVFTFLLIINTALFLRGFWVA